MVTETEAGTVRGPLNYVKEPGTALSHNQE